MKTADWIRCPLCSTHTKLQSESRKKKDGSGRKRFDKFGFDDSYFIQLRNMSGGKGSGFETLSGLTLKEAIKDPRYKDLTQQIKVFCENYLKLFKP